MNLWLVTSIRLGPGAPLRASSIQNLQTAMALAELGHRVLVWVAELDPRAPALVEERFGRPLPAGLRLLAYTPRGPRQEKKTPFFTLSDRLLNFARARLAAPPPDAVITRSPRVIAQLRATRLLPAATRLVLEYQYPEWAQLWREWRHRNKNASLREAVARLRAWRRQEDEWLGLADGILYAARGHELLLHRAAFSRPALWLPSGCLPPDGECGMRNAECGIEEGTIEAVRVSNQSAIHNPQSAIDYDLGYVGSVAPENGLELLLEAVAQLPGARLAVVGGGRESYLAQLRALAVRLGVEERVEFAGPVAFREVRGRMRRCRVGVAPISRREGPEKRQFASPLKLVEWMAAGVPVVATAVPSVCQMARDGLNCLLAAPESPRGLATAAGRLLADPALAAALAREGLATAAAAAWPRRARRIADFIGSLPRA